MRAADERGPDGGVFRCAELLVLRAALAPRRPAPAPLPGSDTPGGGGRDLRPPEDPDRLAELIRSAAADGPFLAALELASPELADAVLAAAVPVERVGDRRRMTLALTAYRLRSRHRATPFGLFSGSALIPRSPDASDRAGSGGLGARHRVRLRPGAAWLAGLIGQLESETEALQRAGSGVRVVTSSAVQRRGSVHVLVDRTAGSPGRWQVRATVARTAMVDTILSLAGPDRSGSRGIDLGRLLDTLTTLLPRPGEVLSCVRELLTAGFLTTDLTPPGGHPDPLAHLTNRLGRHHPVAGPLAELHTALNGPEGDPRQLRERLAEVRPEHARVTADVLLDTDLRVPERLVREVEHAATSAWACLPALPDPRPDRPLADRPLAALHAAVLDRYGLDRPVPLLELLDPVASLGLHRAMALQPAMGLHRTPPEAHAAAEPTPRDRYLTALALDALESGEAEVLLDRHRRRRLTELSRGPGGAPAKQPPSVDVYTEVVTRSPDALAQGEYLVVLGSGGAGPAGSVAGRLVGLLGQDAEDSGLAGRTAGPLLAEVVHRPPAPVATDLVAETGWAPLRIDLLAAGRPSDRDLAVDDLVVTAGLDRLHLSSRRLGRPILPLSWSTLNPAHADPVAQLLLALGREETAPWQPWDWGAAEVLPRLPRVRLGRVVLASARWTVPPELLHLATAASDRHWRAAVQRWREAAQVPGLVMAGRWDRRLPLDLDDPVHLALFRRECHAPRGEALTVTEPPGGEEAWQASGWPLGSDGPHTAELVFPLSPRTAPASQPVSEPRPGQTGRPGFRRTLSGAGPRVGSDRPVADQVFLPGGPWLGAALTAPAELHVRLLSALRADDTLHDAVTEAGVDRWFFVRAADASGTPELRLRFHGAPERLNSLLLPALHDSAERLRAAGLVRDLLLGPYRPELWRYGGAGCIDDAERFFHHDSLWCLELLGSPGTADPPEALAAPGVLSILTSLLGTAAVRRLRAPRLSPAESRLLQARLSPARPSPVRPSPELGRPPETVIAHGRGAATTWRTRLDSLFRYRSRLLVSGRDPRDIAWSLVHMHCNRLVGPDRAVERRAVALACRRARTAPPTHDPDPSGAEAGSAQ